MQTLYFKKTKKNKTMKANEIRLGNWVNTSFYNDFCIIGIIAINDKDSSYFKSFEYYPKSAKLDSLIPIELTEDWLIKFGFKKSESNFYYLNDFGIDKEFNAFSFKSCLWTSSRIKYVHRLQNLYFEMTGKELKIN